MIDRFLGSEYLYISRETDCSFGESYKIVVEIDTWRKSTRQRRCSLYSFILLVDYNKKGVAKNCACLILECDRCTQYIASMA